MSRASLATLALVAGAVFMPSLLLIESASPASEQTTGLIAFVSYPGTGIKTIPAAGGVARRLTESGSSPVWSPDGSWIAFVDTRHIPESHPCRDVDKDKECPSAIYVVRRDGSGERRITPPAVGTRAPAWSPDSRRLAFQRGFPQALYVTTADGTSLRRLTKSNRDYEGNASWSADGKAIAFEADSLPSDQTSHSDIYVASLDGRQRKLTRGVEAHAPHWSPDGQWIAYGTDPPSGNEAIFLVDPLGKLERPLTRSSANAYDMAWSPDSSRIAYIKGSELDPGLFTVAIGSGRVLRLTPKRFLIGWDSPSWSPSGDELVVGRSTSGGPDGVWIIKADGSTKWNLLRRAHSGTWQPSGR